MAQPRELAVRFEAYGDWRKRLALGVSKLHEWLREHELADAGVDLNVRQILERLHQDKVVVAFVGAHSPGKSELINAIFFADFGTGLLPATAGRTTMCPSELLHDATRIPSIRLLPIETRLKDATVQDFRNRTDDWVTLPLDLSDTTRFREALARLSEVKQVSVALARALGLADDDDEPGAAGGAHASVEARVEVPCWRQAIINVPHPLLQQGLVILEMPGPDATGTEPELTLSLLPGAHVVLFVLAADVGATKSDLDVWKRHLAGNDVAQRAGRLVVLNKIDCLWDDLEPEAAVAAEIERQVVASAGLLELPPDQVFPVSAQKGLLAKVGGDDALLRKSRLPALEDTLSGRLISVKHEIVGAATRAEIRALAASVRAVLEARQASIAVQLAELRELRGKNQDVVLHMMDRVKEEKELFERGLQRFTALRTVFSQQTNALFDVIGLEALRTNAGRTRRSIERSPFTSGVRGAMADFFTLIRRDFDDAGRRATEIHDMMQAMYTRFSNERGTEPFTPPPFSVLKYQKEIDRLERAYNQHFNTLWNMLSKAKFSLTRGFFETVASRVKHVYEVANRDVEDWLRAVMSPLETEFGEHHLQLKRRLESVKRIHAASGELEARIDELEQQHEAFANEIATLMQAVESIDAIALQPEAMPSGANA